MPELFIARQPIYNRTQYAYGYALSYRPLVDEPDADKTKDGAISRVILSALADIGIESLAGRRVVFVKLTRDFLIGKYPMQLPTEKVVVEIRVDDEISNELLAGVNWLVKQGYTIALSSSAYNEAILPLFKLVHIVKIDVQALSENRLQSYVAALKEYSHLKLLAENIEIPEEYEVCRELGFDYFQGSFFFRPRVIRRTRLSLSQVVLIQMLATVQRNDITMSKLEALIAQDVGLSYKLLRYINSEFFGMSKPVENTQRAVRFLGIKVIQKWVTLLILSRIDDKPAELMITAVVRAKMCELLAKAMNSKHEDTCFTVGMLSVLEALLDMPMEKILGKLSLSADINQALLRHAGVPGELLEITLRYELGDWDQLTHLELSERQIRKAYLQSVAWANEACRSLLGD